MPCADPPQLVLLVDRSCRLLGYPLWPKLRRKQSDPLQPARRHRGIRLDHLDPTHPRIRRHLTLGCWRDQARRHAQQRTCLSP